MKESKPVAAWVIAISLMVLVAVFLARSALNFGRLDQDPVGGAGVLVSAGIFTAIHAVVAWLVLRPQKWSLLFATLLGVWAILDPLGGVSLDSVLTAAVGVLIVFLSWTRPVRAFVRGPAKHS